MYIRVLLCDSMYMSIVVVYENGDFASIGAFKSVSVNSMMDDINYKLMTF